jgi:hypothetical protein
VGKTPRPLSLCSAPLTSTVVSLADVVSILTFLPRIDINEKEALLRSGDWKEEKKGGNGTTLPRYDSYEKITTRLGWNESFKDCRQNSAPIYVVSYNRIPYFLDILGFHSGKKDSPRESTFKPVMAIPRLMAKDCRSGDGESSRQAFAISVLTCPFSELHLACLKIMNRKTKSVENWYIF